VGSGTNQQKATTGLTFSWENVIVLRLACTYSSRTIPNAMAAVHYSTIQLNLSRFVTETTLNCPLFINLSRFVTEITEQWSAFQLNLSRCALEFSST